MKRIGTVWATGVCLGAAAALLMALGGPTLACGFHASYFRNEFYDDWQKIKERIAHEQKADRSGRTARNVRTHQMAGNLPGVINELIRILKYVDPYNDAADSPPWMHYEEGRLRARESALKILQEIGGKAAPQLVDALVEELRFESPVKQKLLQKVQVARDRVEAALLKLRQEMDRFPAVKQAYERSLETPDEDYRLLEAWRHLVVSLPIPMERPKVRRPVNRRNNRPPQPRPETSKHRSMPVAQYQQYQFLRLNLAGQNIVNFIGADTTARSDPQISKLLSEYQLAQGKVRTEVTVFNAEMERLGQKNGGSGDMIPCEDYASDLEVALKRIGLPAQAALRAMGNRRNRKVYDRLMRIHKAIGAQKPIPLEELQPPGGGEAQRLAALSLLIWDVGDPKPLSPWARSARGKLEAKGEKVIPDILKIMSVRKLALQKECGMVLQMLTGEKWGSDYVAWADWYRTRGVLEQAESLMEAPKEEFVIEPRTKPKGLARSNEDASKKEPKKVGWRDVVNGLSEKGKSETSQEVDGKKPPSKAPTGSKEKSKPGKTKSDRKVEEEEEAKRYD